MLTAASLQNFLDTDWQQQPKLFRDAVDVSSVGVDNDVLADLACDDLVESRLVSADGELMFGPFEHSADTSDLLPPGFMLMVQCLEQHLASVSELLSDNFAFIPRWQVDDVMASTGGDGVSCGAHFDRYDVFLLQVHGEKTWHLDEGNHQESELRDDVDTRLLSEFTATQTLTVKPGDVLYVPPGVGHHGICVGDSLTLSVGIRNPSMAEVLADLASEALAQHETGQPTEQTLHQPGNLPGAVSQQLKTELDDIFNQDLLMNWYGCFVTRLRDPDLIQPPETVVRGNELAVPLASRLALFVADDRASLFVNGEGFDVELAARSWLEDFIQQRQAGFPDDSFKQLNEVIDELLAIGALHSVS